MVYRAVDAFKRRQVAIKQLHAHLLRQPEQAERYRKLLRNEVMLTARLRHPNIVRLLDADEHAAQPYLVLEYVAGQPLSAFASADTLLPLAQVLDIAYKCCNALEHAQREGLVHRDIKPANVLLSEQGEVKLTDFGAALAVRSDATQLAGLVGSPSYMSPEQVQEQDLGHHSDMFSLAVVVYELLTGRRPLMATPTLPPCTASRTRRPRRPGCCAPTCPSTWTPCCCARWPSGRKSGLPPGRTLPVPCWPCSTRCPPHARKIPKPSAFALLRALPFLPTSTT